jgi:mannose-6-phosphate isomerase-like protein (cupin superfamily)
MNTVQACVRKRDDFTFTITVPGDTHRAGTHRMVDYKLPEVTGNRVRGVGAPRPEANEPRPDLTGFKPPWHYHVCDLQAGIVLAGSGEISFNGVDYFRTVAGDILHIPGNAPHDVREPSADYEPVEFTFPGSFDTIDCEPPPKDVEVIGRSYNWGYAQRINTERGIAQYLTTLPSPIGDQYSMVRERRSLATPFVPGTISHGDFLRFLFVVTGRRDIVLHGEASHLERGDILVLPGDSTCEDQGASNDYEGVWYCMKA